MLSFKPEDETQMSASYIADDDGLKCGRCEFTYAGFEMRFTEIDCDDDMVKEGLFRSALNYCANRGVFTAFLKADMLCPAAQRLGWSSDNLTVEIPDALASSCCHCSK